LRHRQGSAADERRDDRETFHCGHNVSSNP
jgi:hypothetical protein